MERYPLGNTTGINFRPTAFQYLHLLLFVLVNDADIANHADDTTPYVSGDKISTVVASIERSAHLMFNWFADNQIKRNEDKCCVLFSAVEILQVKIGAALVLNVRNY